MEHFESKLLLLTLLPSKTELAIVVAEGITQSVKYSLNPHKCSITMNDSTSVEEMQRIVNQDGRKAVEIAKSDIASRFEFKDDVSIALRYFINVTLHDALPVFPAFVSMACEAVGGKVEKTQSIGAAISLISWAADLHDDVIDQSPVKNGKRTVLGKFGKNVTILSGDALLVLGMARLLKECGLIRREQSSKILDLVTHTVIEMCRAEALESKMRTRKNSSMKACLRAIEVKSIVPETMMKIGAVLGNGNSQEIETLGQFGRIFGNVSTVGEEMMDVLEIEELRNRLCIDYPPLPYLCALRDPVSKTEVLALTEELNMKNFAALKKLILNSAEVIRLKREMKSLVQAERDSLCSITKNEDAYKKLLTILTSSLALLERIDGLA